VPRKTLRPHLEIVKSRDSGTGKVITLAKSKPTQLALFQTFFPADTEDYSNTIELYDAIPKYFGQSARSLMVRSANSCWESTPFSNAMWMISLARRLAFFTCEVNSGHGVRI